MRILRLVFALALAFGPARAFAQDPVSRFLTSDYTLCDVHFVSKTFEFTTQESKAYIGQKLEWGTTDILDGDLANARARGKKDPAWRCTFTQSQFTPDDAQALAKAWGVPVNEAKTRIEEKILDGQERWLANEMLPAARAGRKPGAAPRVKPGQAPRPPKGADGDLSAFLTSDRYDACHAKMLVGTYFGATLEESKTRIGSKIREGNADSVEFMLDDVRKRHQDAGTTPCGFHETRFSYADAEKLAQVWGQSVSEAKVRVEQKYAWGGEGIVAEELRSASGMGPRAGGIP